MPDEITIARMMTTLDMEFKGLYITMMMGMRLPMTMGSHPGSQDLPEYTPYLQQRPPLTKLTSPQPSIQSHPSLLDILEVCHSEKASAGT